MIVILTLFSLVLGAFLISFAEDRFSYNLYDYTKDAVLKALGFVNQLKANAILAEQKAAAALEAAKAKTLKLL